jgi:hypothetical protein
MGPALLALALAAQDWVWRPPVKPAPPPGRSPIDALLAPRLVGLPPAPPADRRTLIRRAAYDLTGLPPSPEEVEAFERDGAPDAYERLLDRLLASPRYGEKWGRHWLDLVRYAETNGYERDGPKHAAWRYRDYVIQSFNADKPYDRFLVEQLAGDQLDPVTPETLIATGFYRLGIWDDEPTDKTLARYDMLDDVLSTIGGAMLGLSMGCVRCHEHKKDPIPHEDYYRLLAFIGDITDMDKDATIRLETPEEALERERIAREREAAEKAPAARLKELEARVRAALGEGADAVQVGETIQNDGRRYLGEEGLAEYHRLKRELKRLRERPEGPGLRILAVQEGEPRPMRVLARGNPELAGAQVAPGFPRVLGFPDPPAGGPKRRALAEWIASPRNPLTARVMANRLWQHHFGRGIVATPNDFGGLGRPPTHPELLDWLACELVEGGWRLKRMHKLIMSSEAYRRASGGEGPEEFGARFAMRRLSAEEIRDSILWLTGSLNLEGGGPSVYPELPPEVLATASRPDEAWGESSPEEQNRRSVYVYVKRSLIEPVLGTFDLADTDSSTPVRFVTTVPTQALTMLNGAFVRRQAEALAARLRREAGADPTAQVRRALRLALQREPGDAEVLRGVELIRALPPERAPAGFCLMVLNLNEFIYVD